MEEIKKIQTVEDIKIYLLTKEEMENKRHEEIIGQYVELKKMITPVYQAFTFKKELSKKQMSSIVKWSKIIGFFLLIISAVGVFWKVFVFTISQIIPKP